MSPLWIALIVGAAVVGGVVVILLRRGRGRETDEAQ